MRAIVLFSTGLMLAVAASGGIIQVQPLDGSTIIAGRSFIVELRIQNVDDLYAHQLDIAFDPAILAPSTFGAIEGTFLSDGGQTVFFPGVVDSGAGTVSFIANTLVGPVPGVSGTGALGVIAFRAISPGVTPINPLNVVLLDSNSREIVPFSFGVTITVLPNIPEPNTASLLAGAIGLGLLRRYWLTRRSRSARSVQSADPNEIRLE